MNFDVLDDQIAAALCPKVGLEWCVEASIGLYRGSIEAVGKLHELENNLSQKVEALFSGSSNEEDPRTDSFISTDFTNTKYRSSQISYEDFIPGFHFFQNIKSCIVKRWNVTKDDGRCEISYQTTIPNHVTNHMKTTYLTTPENHRIRPPKKNLSKLIIFCKFSPEHF